MAGSVALPTITASPESIEDTSISSNLQRDEAYWHSVKLQFSFAQDLLYFNNASLGACPNQVQQATHQFRNTLDGYPSKYMWGGWDDEKETVRKKVASLLQVSKEEIALIHNTTEGMNLIARSFDLKKGDEIILANHEHASGTIPWQVWQASKGIKLVRPKLPIIPADPMELVEVYRKAITRRTKIISMCHIVNTNGMMLPVKAVSQMAREKGILVAVDGAQSAGMVDINLDELGCDFYAASSHKWLFSPKGVGILFARKESQAHLKPLIVARGYKNRSIRRLENYNTRNLPEVLGLGAAVDFINEIGIKNIHQRTMDLKHYFRSKLEGQSNLIIKTPAGDNLSGGIQVVEVAGKRAAKVKQELIDQHQIDCRSMSGFDLNAVRLSFAIYNTKADVDRLVAALQKIAS